jgi:serine/threonine protein kinase
MTGLPDPFAPRPAAPAGDVVTQTADGRASLLRIALEPAPFTLAPDDQIGPFKVLRPLGRGGMGEVYEAEEWDSGRRVALKLLLASFDRPSDREQFLQEGRLAATIRDPHTVYVYGTYDFDGVLGIAMELLSSRTLRDLVAEQGALSIPAACDAILDLVAGLEAAAAAGVLHRDVKPSNCFVDDQGRVKVGDFGLSIVTSEREDLPQDVAATPVLATPEFASPEQLRGERLDHSSDVYSTAATLYFLLSARAPVAGDSVGQVITQVLSHEIPQLRLLRPGVPVSLARAVMQCLSAHPSSRLTYSQLRHELARHGSAGLPAARPTVRLCAAFIDAAILTLPFEWLERQELWSAALALYSPSRLAIDALVGFLYFSVHEGCWGASIGKVICGLRVVRIDGRPAGVVPVALRAAVYHGAWLPMLALLLLAPGTMSSSSSAGIPLQMACASLISVALFLPARPPWFSGLHDRISGTRVVARDVAGTRQPIGAREAAANDRPHFAARVGPYLVSPDALAGARPRVVPGYDPALRRPVWIQQLTLGAAPVTPARQDLRRPGRLRWLCGRRNTSESWDAYDAPAGVSLSDRAWADQPWSAVRFWLADLAEEVDRTTADGSDHRRIDPRHVWLTSDGRAMLLDFPAPGVSMMCKPCDMDPAVPATIQPFLAAVGTAVLSPGPPLPLTASALLMRMQRNGFSALPVAIAALRAELRVAPLLSRRRRFAHLALTTAIPLFTAVAVGWPSGEPFSIDHLMAAVSGVLFFSAGLGVWSAGLTRGGILLHACGIAVAREGMPASRPRALIRAIVGWMPAMLVQVALGFGALWFGFGLLVVWAATALLTAVIEGRGIHDRLAGTYLTAA